MDQNISRAWKWSYWLICSAIFAAFVTLGQTDRGVVGAFIFASIALAIRIRWDLRNQFWYKALFTTLIAAHILALFTIDWSLYLKPTILYAPLVIADFSFIVFLIFFLEKYFASRSK